IDFVHRAVWWFVDEDHSAENGSQIQSYLAMMNSFADACNVPRWSSATLPFNWGAYFDIHGAPGRIVCTETTDRVNATSVIRYSIREKLRKRRDREEQPQPRVQPRVQPQPQQRAYAYDWVAFEPSFTELLPSLRAELPNKVPLYDP